MKSKLRNTEKNCSVICLSKIFRIFVVSDRRLGSITAQNKRGFFYCPLQYGGGLFASRKGDPDQGSDSVNDHRFFIGLCQKLGQMENLLGTAVPLAISAEKIIDDLVTSDEISNLRADLREMLHYYLLQEDDSYFRRKVHASYLTLDMMLQKVETNEKLNLGRRVA